MQSIEDSILSAVMYHSDNMMVAVERGVNADWFVSNGDVWDEVLKAFNESEWNNRNCVSVLTKFGVYNNPRALDLCHKTPEWAGKSEEVGDAIEVFAIEFAKRTTLEVTQNGINLLVAGGDPFDISGSIVHELQNVDSLFSTGKERTTADIARDAFDIDTKISAGECVGLPFPWSRFQLKTFGVPFKAVTPLGGRDGMGKSRLAIFLTEFWVSQDIPTLYFAFEDSAERMLSNCAATHGGYDMFSIKRGNQNPSFMMRHKESIDHLVSKPLYIEDCPCTVERLVSAIARYKRKFGIVAVVVDGLKDVILTSGENQTTKEGHVNATLVRASKKYNVAILAISHLTDIEDGKWISKRNIRGTKTQSQSARMALMYQDAGFPDKITSRFKDECLDDCIVLECQKASYGDRGSVVLRPNMERGRFEEVIPGNAG